MPSYRTSPLEDHPARDGEIKQQVSCGGVVLGEILHSGIDLPCFTRKYHPSALSRLDFDADQRRILFL
jgi:hypothetical protein